ncbi:MAG: hypothetical protein Kow0077_21200 [Anaerolineae bacterium]
MLIFGSEDLLLKKSVPIYNNVAHVGEARGRLSVVLELHSQPRIWWEFEQLGEDTQTRFPSDPSLTILGHDILIEKAIRGSYTWNVLGYKEAGYTPQVNYGDVDAEYARFEFYLPNARFHSEVIAWDKDDPSRRKTEVDLDDAWQITLITSRESLDWLDWKNKNVGALLTTQGFLTAKDDLSKLSLKDARDLLFRLSDLLSFANGGYLGPLYVEGFQLKPEKMADGMFLAYSTDPLECLRQTWLFHSSDLVRYLQCFEAYKKMTESALWSEVLTYIFLWYFHAIQTDYWPVQAISLGVALEYLLLTISEETGKNFGGNKRVDKLLNYMGISEPQQDVDAFWEIRNDATHLKAKTAYANKERGRCLQRATQWVEEIILWRLGYDGQYLDRSKKHVTSIDPRYDLSTRLPEW